MNFNTTEVAKTPGDAGRFYWDESWNRKDMNHYWLDSASSRLITLCPSSDTPCFQ